MNRIILIAILCLFSANAAAKKPEWTSKLPEDTKTVYFFGVKLSAASFEEGKKQAVRNGLIDVMNYLGVKVKTRYEERLSEIVENEILARSKGKIENLHLSEIYYETEKKKNETFYNVYVLLSCPKETIEKERDRLLVEESAEKEKIFDIFKTGTAKESAADILAAFQYYSLALKLFEEEGYDNEYNEIYKKILGSYQNISLVYNRTDKNYLTVKVSYKTANKMVPLKDVMVNYKIVQGEGSIEKRVYTDENGTARSKIFWLGEGENLVESSLPLHYLIKTGNKQGNEEDVTKIVCKITGSGRTSEGSPIKITIKEFQDQAQDKEYEWLASAITNGLMNRLSCLRNVRFLPEEESDISLQGAFYKQDTVLKIYVRLQNLNTGVIEKTVVCTVPVSESFSVEEKLAFKIAEALNIPLNVSEKDKLKKQVTSNPLIYKYLNEGMQFYKSGKFDDAAKMFEMAIKLDKDCAIAYNNLGLVKQALGLYREAVSHFKKAVEISPLDERLYFNLGSVYYNAGEIDGAFTYYEKSLEINPELTQANLALSVLYNEKNSYDKAVEKLKKVIEQNPQNSEAVNQLGIVYDNMKNYKEAVKCYKEALKLKPYSAKIYNNLGVAYDNLALYDEAITAYQNGLSIDPQYANIWTNLGLAYAHKGDYDKALSSCQTAVKINPDGIASYYNLAGFFAANNKVPLALNCIKKIVELDETEKNKIADNPDLQALKTNPDFLEIIK